MSLLQSSNPGSRRQALRKHYGRRPRVEPLEDRRLLAVLTVGTEVDVVDPADGVTSLREAIAVANATPGADEIVFDFGHDGPATILLEHGELEITDALSITGDGPDLLTIDAQQQSRIFNITAQTGNFAIAGMTLTGGLASGEYVDSIDTSFNGGAIRSLSSGVLSIENSIIRDNSSLATATGLAIVLDHSAIGGGGVFAVGSVILKSSTISDNTTNGNGGGVRAAEVTAISSTIAGNSSTGTKYTGGGISATGNVTITDSTINGNSAGSGSEGGGIYAGGRATIVSSTISGNSAGNAGGGVSARSATVISSTVVGNSADGEYLEGCDGGPTPLRGGGIQDTDGLTIQNSIVAANTYRGQADDLDTNAAKVNVAHSLIGSNTNVTLAEAPVGSPDANGNLIGGLVHGAISPKLAALADNGGPTRTHALLPSSPAIDAGVPAAVAGVAQVPRFDQRGELFDRVSGGRIDMGAVELQQPEAATSNENSPSPVFRPPPRREFVRQIEATDAYFAGAPIR